MRKRQNGLIGAFAPWARRRPRRRSDPIRIAMLAVLALTAAAAVAAPPLAIRAGHLLDPDREQVQDNVVIVIQDGRVQSVGDQVPAGVELIDLSDRWLLPGFIDAHTHVLLQGDVTAADYTAQVLGESMPYRALRATRAMSIALDHGFTTLRDLGSEGAGFVDVDLQRAQQRGIIRGPSLVVAGKALAPTGAYGPSGGSWQIEVPKGVELCDGADACRRAVRDQLAHGADWIKLYVERSYFKNAEGQIRGRPNFTADELRAMVDEAHRNGHRVAAHSMTPTGHVLALAAGVDSIEHGPVLDAESIAAMVRQGVYWCPTASVLAAVAPGRSQSNPIWSDLLAAQSDSFRRALKAGVRIVLGTDAGGFAWDEINQAEEFGRYVALGMRPWQALRAGTLGAAELLDRQQEIGRIAPGYRADIVALAADPINDIHATEQVVWVMQAGRVVKSGARTD